MRLITLLAFLLSSLLSQVPARQQPTGCPDPLAIAEGQIGLRVITSNGYLVYTVDRMAAGGTPYHELYSVPVDGSAPALLLHDNQGQGTLLNGVFALSPDGEYISFAPTPTEALVASVADGHLAAHITLDDGETLAGPPDFTQDGQSLLFATGNDSDLLSMYHMPLPDGEPQLITGRIARSWFFLQDDGWLIYIARMDDGTPKILRQRTQPPFTQIDLSGEIDVSRLLISNIPLVFQPAGNYLVFESSDGQQTNDLYSVDINGGDAILLHSAPHGWTREGVASPDGRYIAFEQNGELFTVPLDGSTPPVFIAQIDPAPYLQFTPDSRYITYVGYEQDVAGTLFFAPVEGGPPIPYETDHRFSKNYRLRPVGDSLLVQDSPPGGQQLVVYSLSPDRDVPLHFLFDSVWDYAYSPFVLAQDGTDTFVFRRYDGEHTSLFQARVGEDFAPVEIGCALPGHTQIAGLSGDRVVYIAEGNAIYAAPLE